jgi:dienelactone hydrolase
VFHDAYGYDSARTHHVCADLARRLNCLVVAPDCFDDEHPGCCGGGMVKLVTSNIRLGWPAINDKLQQLVLPWVRGAHGGNVQGPLAALGFCWGGWAVTRLAGEHPCPIVCGVGFHPSVHMQALQPRGEPGLKACLEQVSAPLLYCPSSQDPSALYPGGWIIDQLSTQKGVEVHPFKQNHGFVNRGDMRDPRMAQDVEKAIALATQFMAGHFDKSRGNV